MNDVRARDALIAIALAAALELQIVLQRPEGSLALNVVSGLLLTLPLIWRRRSPLAVLGVFGVTGIVNEALGGALFTFPDGAGSTQPPLFASLLTGAVVFYTLGVDPRRRISVAGLALGIALLWGCVISSDQLDIGSLAWSAGLVATTPWLIGRVTRSRQLQFASLEREQDQRTRLAISDERARIAREIHDVVAHNVGVILAQAEGGRRVFDRDPARAREALGSIEETARSALREMRRSLGVLREGRDEDPEVALAPQPSIERIDELVSQARAGGLEVEVVVEGEPRPLPRDVDLSAYRIVQEALTNTLKHAGPAHSRVVVSYGETELALHVADDGAGPHAVNGDGHGLVGMGERVASHGGRLRTGRGEEGGFEVAASLPLGAGP